ncbi:MAG TPA: nucleotidyltransferase domain-containing protein [Geminicoccaceae bacterium]|nr:nucleotidyltransferase domain-containing protein [Geminicoccaceae bacterium]
MTARADPVVSRPGLVPRDLLDRVVRYFEPEAVILFGSHARGAAGPDSDYDLLVILADDAPAEKRTLRAGWESRRGWHGAVDVVPCRRGWFEEKRDVVNSLAWIADTQGVMVYGRL